MNSFVPAYLQALANRMSQVAAPEHLVKTLLSATRQMVENYDPEQTLEAKFDAAFYPNLGVARQDVQAIIDRFYAEDFPKLKQLTQTKPEAAEIVHQILGRGDQIAIATNPLFPRTAITQRLDWAGLPTGEIPYILVSSYEAFHFAKPNPAFYAEFLAQLGWPSSPVVMVGNDVESDIKAARKLSIPVFWLTSDGSSSWDGQGEVPPNGDLTALVPFLESANPSRLPSSYYSPDALLAILRSTPAALTTLSRQKPQKISKRPALKEWSPGEVFCHLRDVDLEVNLWRLNKVVTEQNPFLPGQDTDPWADARHYETQDGLQALSEFMNTRKQVLRLLEILSGDDWNRPARHAIFGPTTLRELVNIIAGHDILHMQQVFRVL